MFSVFVFALASRVLCVCFLVRCVALCFLFVDLFVCLVCVSDCVIVRAGARACVSIREWPFGVGLRVWLLVCVCSVFVLLRYDVCVAV